MKILSMLKEITGSFFGREKRAWFPLAFSCILFVLYLIKTFSPASNGGALIFPPDALEYSMGCASLLESGRYGIQLDGMFYPSRYLPWFSAMICLPAVRLFHGDILAAVYSIWFCAAGAVLLAFLLGRKNGSWMTGLCAASLLFLSPMFRPMIQMVMTEIPYIFFLLLMLAAWLKITESDEVSWKMAALFAILTAFAGAIRSSAFPMLILPFVYSILKTSSWRKRILLTGLLVVPSCLVLLGGFLYNYKTFGSGFRNGYQYWCSVPYDYPSLCFSFSYIKDNLRNIVSNVFFPAVVCEILVIILAVFLYRKKKVEISDERKRLFTAEILFALMQGMILLLLYLPYFFTDNSRFFMPVEALLTVPAVVAFELLLQKWKILLRCGMILLLGLGIWETATYRTYRLRSSAMIEELKLADKFLPEDAALISDNDCALFEYYFVKKTDRRYIPLSRGQEYLNKVIVPVSVGPLDPPPRSPSDHQTEALLRAPGCFRPYRWTIEEGPEQLRQLLKERPVFLLTGDYLQHQDRLRTMFPDAAFYLAKNEEFQIVQMFIPNGGK